MIYYYVKINSNKENIIFYHSMESLFEGSAQLDVSYGLINIKKEYKNDDGITEEELKELLNVKTRKK